MPYIKPEARKALSEGGIPSTVGDLNYLISLELKRLYSSDVSYGCIEKLFALYFEHPESNQFLRDLARGIPFSAEQVQRASKLAYLEFSDVVVRRHEDIAAVKNGQIYEDILLPIPTKVKGK